MKIDPFTHRCIVPDGPMAGNKHTHSVEAYEVEYQDICPICGERLATTAQIIAHIYSELTEGN